MRFASVEAKLHNTALSVCISTSGNAVDVRGCEVDEDGKAPDEENLEEIIGEIINQIITEVKLDELKCTKRLRMWKVIQFEHN